MSDEQPRSKSIKVSGDRKSGVIVKRVNQADGFKNHIPGTLGEPHPTEDGLYFIDADYQPLEGGWGDLSINYSWKKNSSYDTELRTALKQAPLKANQNYRLKWDYAIISESETTEPTWWDEAKSFEDIKDESDFGDFEFVKNASQAGTKTLIKDRIKSVDFWLKPTVQVLERWYFVLKVDAQNHALGIGQHEAPLDDFGVLLKETGGKPALGNWLVTSAPVSRDGGYWVIRKTYELSEEIAEMNDGVDFSGWDDDIYGDKQS